MKKAILAFRKKTFPTVSIILPVNKENPHFGITEERMNSLLKQTEEKLLDGYISPKAKPLIKDMYNLAKEIDYRNLSEGLGLYVSPYRESILHFPFPVKEKIVIDKTFEMRDMLFAAKNSVHYAVLIISEKVVRVFHGLNRQLTEKKYSAMPYNLKDTGGKGHSRTGTFTSFASAKNVSDQKAYAEKRLNEYIREIDRVILEERSLKNTPIVICAPKRILGHFKGITKNNNHIIGYVHGNFDRAEKKDIYEKIAKLIGAQPFKKQQEALKKLEEATGKKETVSGIRDVWKAAYNKEGRLLLIEQDFYCPAKTGKKPDTLITDDLDAHDIHYMNDAVDDVIELVMKYGGDVIFVENGLLAEHGRIALITRF